MSFFDEVQTTVLNSRLLMAVEDTGPVNLKLKPFEELGHIVEHVSKSITIESVLKPDTITNWYYLSFLKDEKTQQKDVASFLEQVANFRIEENHQETHDLARDIFKKFLVTYFEPNAEENDEQNNGVSDVVPGSGRKSTENAHLIALPSDSANDTGLASKKKRYKEAYDAAWHPWKINLTDPEVTEAIKQSTQRDRNEGRQQPDLFDTAIECLKVGLQSSLPVFFGTVHFQAIVQMYEYARRPVTVNEFRFFRVLGRGAFGEVSAAQRVDTSAIFAIKEMGKKQVKSNKAEYGVVNEMKVLQIMKSPFVLNLKYSFHNSESLYLAFDLCSGGDLRFHVKHGDFPSGFPLEMATFFAAEVLLGLEHIHSHNIVYRDLKPNNILLDAKGHVKISDLGLAVKIRSDKKLKHLAGTAGYWAPEVLDYSGTELVSDFWSLGVFIHELLCGKRVKCKCKSGTKQWCPFSTSSEMEKNAKAEGGTLHIELDFPADPKKFNEDTVDLLTKLFTVDKTQRLGANGVQEIKDHPFFKEIDWDLLAKKEIKPTFIPSKESVNATSVAEVGEFNRDDFKKIKLSPDDDEKYYKHFTWNSTGSTSIELLNALKKMSAPGYQAGSDVNSGCCAIL